MLVKHFVSSECKFAFESVRGEKQKEKEEEKQKEEEK